MYDCKLALADCQEGRRGCFDQFLCAITGFNGRRAGRELACCVWKDAFLELVCVRVNVASCRRRGRGEALLPRTVIHAGEGERQIVSKERRSTAKHDDRALDEYPRRLPEVFSRGSEEPLDA